MENIVTYVFTRHGDGEKVNWSPRTSYSDNWEGAKRKIEKVIAEEYDLSEAAPLVTGVLLVYFSGGRQPEGGRPQDMPEVHQFRVERVTPKLIRV